MLSNTFCSFSPSSTVTDSFAGVASTISGALLLALGASSTFRISSVARCARELGVQAKPVLPECRRLVDRPHSGESVSRHSAAGTKASSSPARKVICGCTLRRERSLSGSLYRRDTRTFCRRRKYAPYIVIHFMRSTWTRRPWHSIGAGMSVNVHN
ncbi:hypothetical protein CYME_CMP174C [Cyanidioschyzon merolae strain 10D]|uniref:Uncharacterized protein n=1 Tax=Cyanidioschyzon merolae (strain NIES-3377 / 10D) TaxID=280699 RepID=M1V9Y5_CYAM1|nr:hypothetical protein CYME_CMP174C [Cyanidioschyzon merolae strain 10D]BAM81804.1 hypothetical protein CYME_CMP174C [Cyanidioschyzon merolae strain 10D]|eukprot:XP_005537840.1 hypothetical protein CYME_CMP174C [Cyanidioschyzon merolae strain 10D]